MSFRPMLYFSDAIYGLGPRLYATRRYRSLPGGRSGPEVGTGARDEATPVMLGPSAPRRPPVFIDPAPLEVGPVARRDLSSE